MRAETMGKQLKTEFIQQRLQNNDKSFFGPIKRQKLLTMDHVNKKVCLTTTQGKVSNLL